MRIVNVSQSKDREAWLELRRGVITGTKAKGIAPPKRGKAIPQGVYELLAEKVAIAKDGEDERERGQRLENESIRLTAKKFGLKITDDPGMWLSDDGKIGVSPDAAEKGDNPTFAIESKSLDSKNHLQAILNDVEARKSENYNPLGSLKISREDYAPQVIQYFFVNPHLQTVYFSLYDDRIALDNVVHYVITIDRSDVEEMLAEQATYEHDAIEYVDKLIKVLEAIK